MKVTIITLGSRGDVQPFIALARALDAGGHEATVATQSPFESLVTGQGARFAPLGVRPDAIARFDEFSRLQHETGRRAHKILKHANQWILELLDDQLAGGEAACRGADVLVEGTMAMLTPHLAELFDLPFARAYLRPETRTSAYRRPDLVYPESRFAWRRRGSYSLPMIAVWSTVRRRVNEWRIEKGLRPWGIGNPTQHHHYAHRFPVLLGYSELVAPRPPDYPPWHHLTGFWTVDAAATYDAPAAVAAFLEAGPPPVTIGFGSIPVLDPSAMWQCVLEALDRTGQRGVVLTGWGGLDRRRVRTEPADDRRTPPGGAVAQDDVLVVDAVPHDWIYPRSRAVVHHGGAGAAAAAFRAGTPMVVVPFLWDQAFWADRAHRLGVGPAGIPQAELTTDRLVDAINAATTPLQRAQAERLGARLRREDGPDAAIRILEEAVAGGRAACFAPGRRRRPPEGTESVI